MNFYYGLVDAETNAWGFVEETDPRVHEDMIYLTHAEWQALLAGQSRGLQICYYDGKVFNAEPGRYYLDDDGWHKKTDEEFNNEKAAEAREDLVQYNYECKADKAYGGVVINDLLVFETNQTAITNTVASLALMGDEDTSYWKFYNKQGEPVVQQVNKQQLAYIAKFGQNMINQCFGVEGTFNAQIKTLTTAQLIDPEFVEGFKAQIKAAMDEVSNAIVVQFA